MKSTAPIKAIFFDLDGTLSDADRSLRCAISTVQAKYYTLAAWSTENLAKLYNEALQSAYDKYLNKEITYKESDSLKLKLFFVAVGLPEPSEDGIAEFRAVYKAAYRKSRKATPGSIETLTKLRERGYRTAIVTNGQVKDQREKTEEIGVLSFVDYIVTSKEALAPKPSWPIFMKAWRTLDVSPLRW